MNNPEKKIAVAILGATGSVGQKFIQLLENHPWFEVKEVVASERSAGKKYPEAANWFLPGTIPENVAKLTVKTLDSSLESPLLFSGLDAKVAGEAEEHFAKLGHFVVSNSKNHRFDKDVPLLIPEVNADHLQLLDSQKYKGKIVTNPNCSTIGLVMALKPLLDSFGLEQLNVATMQAISGAGMPGLPSATILENVIPHIGGEEAKMEAEPLKILGNFKNGEIENLTLPISALCNRVPVIDGHTESVQVKLSKKASTDEIIQAWRNFTSEPQNLKLPFAPSNPIHYFDQPGYPQPRLHRNLENGMAVSIGGLRDCNLFDYKFTVLSHNTIRGAAGGAILNAELMVAKGLI
ncbi:MAG: aspartate-semialdehyde dehydrogenase [Calditrichaeota bacterium]|nr:MAG: aspartate-semialdehyde dehydrogenase [Calditrichota bacterium]MBL1205613.1 aspartate-semialdehyde dehydrogenase [Calditrichota bacterium]NOG45441.1 aspartate-semialdehyde dehydrogenase [Calditrichota bacterium]